MIGSVISVGTELLLGDVVNTNQSFIAKEFFNYGIDVYHMESVGDNKERLLSCLEKMSKVSDVIVITGGLGPTTDDITRYTVGEFLGLDMVQDKNTVRTLREYFRDNDKQMSYGNLRQAYFPANAIILPNNHGTAPGFICETGSTCYIVLPGPPFEMEIMFKENVPKYLMERNNYVMGSKTINVSGITESQMGSMISELALRSSNPTVAPYFSDKGLTIRVTAKGSDKGNLSVLINTMVDKIINIMGNYAYAIGDNISLEHVVGRFLKENGLTISTAESCTGGLLSGRIINLPGASSVFMEGFVTYSNDAKVRLGVDKALIDEFGAVSWQVAEAMARSAALKSGTDVALSTTGIAGPDGGTEEKPVGLVYIGLYYKGETFNKKVLLRGDRNKIRARATAAALDFLRVQAKIPFYIFD